jgi:hypothetical protein
MTTVSRDINIESLKKMYLDGIAINKIADCLNASRAVIYRNIRKLGLPKRDIGILFSEDGKFKGKTLEQKFKDKYIKANNGCWIWTGTKGSNHYGMILHNGRHMLAHRVSYELFIKKPPQNMVVCHKCDNPSCVNPDHLFIGTTRDNIRDCMAKGRKVNYDRHGERNPSAKLTAKQVEEIRDNYEPFKTPRKLIAKQYGVSLPLIDKILSGKVWREGHK